MTALSRIMIAIIASSFLFPLYSQAVSYSLTTTVTKVMTDGKENGGCMAALAANPKTKSPACANSWVSFSCTGAYNPKDLAFDMLDSAKLALALNKRVTITFDDNLLHNGNCTATRIDIIK